MRQSSTKPLPPIPIGGNLLSHCVLKTSTSNPLDGICYHALKTTALLYTLTEHEIYLQAALPSLPVYSSPQQQFYTPSSRSKRRDLSATTSNDENRDQLYKNRSSRKIDSQRLFSREYDFPKTFSVTEN